MRTFQQYVANVLFFDATQTPVYATLTVFLISYGGMMYSMLSGQHPNLPIFAEDTRDLYAYPCQHENTPLVCVEAPCDRPMVALDQFGDVIADTWLLNGMFQVWTIGGNYFSVSSALTVNAHQVATMQAPEASYFVADEANASLPSVAMATGYWLAQGYRVTPHNIVRMRTTTVVGQFALDSVPGWLHTDFGKFMATPGAWLVSEHDGTGLRVVRFEAMGDEFSCVKTESGVVTDTFALA